MTTLMLGRKVNESIWVGSNCQIILAKIDGPNKIKLAVKAPRFVPVCRSEMFAKTKPLPLAEQIMASVIDCLRLNGIDDSKHTVAICDICNCVIDVIGGLRNAI